MKKQNEKIKDKQGLKKCRKKEEAITLIALVVTIIVLLILAGVSIAMLTGEGGILKQAGEARERTGRANIIEQARVDLLEKQTENKGKVSKEDLYNVLNKYFENVPNLEDETWNDEETWKKEEVTGKNDKTVKVQIGEIYGGNLGEKGSLTLVEMYENAQRDGCLNEDGTCTNPEHLHIGDYVNYPNPTSGKYTVGEDESVDKDVLGLEEWGICPLEDKKQTYEITSTKNQLNWRVLGKDKETGGIKLIAGSPMKSNNKVDGKEYPYLFMYGAKAYTNSLKELENICKLYSNTSLGIARSVTQKDIDEITGITTEEKIKEYNLEPYDGNKNYGDSYEFTTDEFTEQYTPESWLNGQTPTTVKGTVTGYYYSISLEEGGVPSVSSNRKLAKLASNIKVAVDGSSEPTVIMKNKRAYNMLFGGLNWENDYPSGKDYWLASLGVFAYSNFAGFGPGTVYSIDGMFHAGTYKMFHSLGGEIDYAFAVRPVVSLKSNISAKEVQKIGDRTEEDWNYEFPSGGGDGEVVE